MEDFSLELISGTSTHFVSNGRISMSVNELSDSDIFHLFEAALRKGNLNAIKHFNKRFPEGKCAVLRLHNEYFQSLLHLLSITGGCPEETRVEIAELFYQRLAGDDGTNNGRQPQFDHFMRTDYQGRTPLHFAAKFRRMLLLKWFLQKNLLQSIFDEDSDGLTPFHYLINTRRDYFVPLVKLYWEAAARQYTFKGSPPLHLAAKQSSLGMIEFLVETAGFSPDEYDHEGHTPLHSAIKYSDEESATTFPRILYLMGRTRCDKYVTQVTRDSPIHIAAMYGKPKILGLLLSLNAPSDRTSGVNDLETPQGVSACPNFIQNDERKGHVMLTSTLNAQGQTCLHVIPNQTVSQGSVECVKIIMDHPALAYPKERERFCLQKDYNNATVLQLAAEHETVQICKEILKTLKCDAKAEWLGEDILLPIYEKIPDALLPVFENCTNPRNDYSRREELMTLELAPIVGRRKHGNGDNWQIAAIFPETHYLHAIDSLRPKIRNRIYRCPLVEKFVEEKFRCLKGFIIAGFLFQLLYICMFIFLAYTVEECEINTRNKSVDTRDNSTAPCDPDEFSYAETSVAIITMIFATCFVLKEVYQFSQNPRQHFKKPSNVVQLGFSLLTFYCVISLLLVDSGQVLSYKLLRILTAAIVLLGGALSLHELKKINWFPSFLRIFIQVAKRSAILLTYYSLLILAFTVIFKILSPQSDDYKFFQGIVKVLTMMVGEYDFEKNFKVSPEEPVHDPLLVKSKLIAFALFIFIAGIVGLNLLIGLAVEDIQELKKDAQLEVLSCQLEQLYMMENFLISLKWVLPRKLHFWILEKINLIVNFKRMNPDGFYNTKFDFSIGNSRV